MNDDEPHEIWYYSHGDEKCGPVTFTDLRALAKDATLNPRHDLVWTKGMDEWKPAGEIEGLFKRRTPEPVAEQVPAAVVSAPTLAPDPYHPPGHDSLAVPLENQGEWPGARRRGYLFATLIFPVVWMAIVGAVTPFLNAQFGAEIMKIGEPALLIIPNLVILYFAIQRLPNLGMSRWWFFANFVPFLNLWVGYRCFACPAGYAYHKKLDGAGIFLAIVYWLLILIVVVAVALVIAALLGGIGTPEFQEQFREGFRKAMEASQQQ